MTNRSPSDEHYSDQEWLELTTDPPKAPAELMRIRAELLKLCRRFCPDLAHEVEVSLLWAELDLVSP